ncbi:MAG: hypothetical protein V8Q80_03575 [Barnesiella intestinihominis]
MVTHLLVGKRSPFQSYTRDWDRLSGTLAYRSYALLTEEGYLSAWETRTEATKIYTVWYRIYNDFVLVCTVPLQ